MWSTNEQYWRFQGIQRCRTCNAAIAACTHQVIKKKKEIIFISYFWLLEKQHYTRSWDTPERNRQFCYNIKKGKKKTLTLISFKHLQQHLSETSEVLLWVLQTRYYNCLVTFLPCRELALYVVCRWMSMVSTATCRHQRLRSICLDHKRIKSPTNML